MTKKELETEILGLDNSWPLYDTLVKLVEATDILLHKKDYDGCNWEEMELCFSRGKEIIKNLEKLKPNIEN